MHTGDKMINRIAVEALNLDESDIEDVERITIDARRGEAVRLQIYIRSVTGEMEVLELRKPSATGVYEAALITEGKEEFVLPNLPLG